MYFSRDLFAVEAAQGQNGLAPKTLSHNATWTAWTKRENRILSQCAPADFEAPEQLGTKIAHLAAELETLIEHALPIDLYQHIYITQSKDVGRYQPCSDCNYFQTAK